MPGRCPKTRGFTLVELLVVVAIIALLISILLPALGQAQAQARLIKCQSQLREYGQASFFYLNDYDDVFPPHRHQESSWGGPFWFNLWDRYWLGEYRRVGRQGDPDWGNDSLDLLLRSYRLGAWPG